MPIAADSTCEQLPDNSLVIQSVEERRGIPIFTYNIEVLVGELDVLLLDWNRYDILVRGCRLPRCLAFLWASRLRRGKLALFG